MSNSSKRPFDRTAGHHDSNNLWHFSGDHSLCLGCQDCFFRADCGGLEVQAALYDCTDFCRCQDPSACDNVCPNRSAAFAARLQEIRGFNLDDIPHAPHAQGPSLPPLIPMIYHGSRRDAPLCVDIAALPLARVVDYSRGTIRFPNRGALLEAFKLRDGCQVLLSGTDRDRDLENWWRLKDREVVIQGLVELGIVLVTTPNFSLFGDVPRTDNLYNIKRIALTWSEIQSRGLACALHLNARTNQDWDRWLQFLKAHPEVDVVAFEFGTGAGFEQRILWHVDQLRHLALQLERPMHLIVRGGVHVLPRLAAAFSSIALIDTRPFVKTYRRQRGIAVDGRLRWTKAPTRLGEPLDQLLEDNIKAATAALAPTEPILIPMAEITRSYKTLRAANDAGNEPLQLGLLDQPSRGKRGTGTIHGEGVIAAAESELSAEIGQSDE